MAGLFGRDAWSRCAFGVHDWPESKLWAADAGFATLGCTHRACYVGAFGVWRRWPRWRAEHDLWLLLAGHGMACATAHLDFGAYIRASTPRLSRPHTLLLSTFATASPFELLWFSGTILGLCGDVQREAGRLGFLALYAAGSAASVAVATYARASANGSGGVLASCAYHALARPHARHALMGIEMGARLALAAQLILASWPAFSGGGGGTGRAATILAANLLPCVVGAALFRGVL